jgi:hypothetical protein
MQAVLQGTEKDKKMPSNKPPQTIRWTCRGHWNVKQMIEACLDLTMNFLTVATGIEATHEVDASGICLSFQATWEAEIWRIKVFCYPLQKSF